MAKPRNVTVGGETFSAVVLRVVEADEFGRPLYAPEEGGLA